MKDYTLSDLLIRHKIKECPSCHTMKYMTVEHGEINKVYWIRCTQCSRCGGSSMFVTGAIKNWNNT